MFSSTLVSLCVSRIMQKVSYKFSYKKNGGKVAHGPWDKPLDFGDRITLGLPLGLG